MTDRSGAAPSPSSTRIYDGCDLGSDFKGKYVALEDYEQLERELEDALRYRGYRDRVQAQLNKVQKELADLKATPLSESATSIRIAALEEAARRCDSYSQTGRTMHTEAKGRESASGYFLQALAAESCAESIRALKNAAPQAKSSGKSLRSAEDAAADISTPGCLSRPPNTHFSRFTCPKCSGHNWGTGKGWLEKSKWEGYCNGWLGNDVDGYRRCDFRWPRLDDEKYGLGEFMTAKERECERPLRP